MHWHPPSHMPRGTHVKCHPRDGIRLFWDRRCSSFQQFPWSALISKEFKAQQVEAAGAAAPEKRR